MKHLEIPHQHERTVRYRFFEILPGFLSWFILLLPLSLSFFAPQIVPFFVLGFLLLWFSKAVGLNIRALQGFKKIEQYKILPWSAMLNDMSQQEKNRVARENLAFPHWHYDHVERLLADPTAINPSNIMHAIIIAVYNEAREVIEPTIQSVLDSDYDMKKVIVVIAYEERGGPEVQRTVQDLLKKYGDQFAHAMGVQHPNDIPGEVIGKGGNITYAARELEQYLERKKIDPLHTIVTTLDSDNHPHPNYLAALSYVYSICPDPLHVSFQPVPVYTNNIWDAPALMRVIATGNTFWNVILTLRPHMLRNFSSHAQSMQTLIDTDYWSVRTIVEDGHQFWRTYFRYDGNHEVYPLYIPIYQDAVLSSTYLKTIKAQFVQLRRWAWGVSDVAYVAEMGFFRKNKIPRWDMLFKFGRLLEGHISWATAPLLLAFAAFIPLLVNPENYVANQLPFIASRIQTVALTGILVTLFLSLRLLPPKPKRYKAHRSIFMVLQWVLLPVTTIVFNSLSALYSQTRLMFGRYMGKFDVTDKAVITSENKRVM
jgi:hypothetical protein